MEWGFFRCSKIGTECEYFVWDEVAPWSAVEAEMSLNDQNTLKGLRERMANAANEEDYIEAGRLQEWIKKIHENFGFM